MRVFRGWLPLSAALLAVAGAAAGAIGPCWLQPACRNIRGKFEDAPAFSGFVSSKLKRKPGQCTAINERTSGPALAAPCGFGPFPFGCSHEATIAGAETNTGHAAFVAQLAGVGAAPEDFRRAMVAEQHPAPAPTAARRTAGKPGSRVYPNNQEGL